MTDSISLGDTKFMVRIHLKAHCQLGVTQTVALLYLYFSQLLTGRMNLPFWSPKCLSNEPFQSFFVPLFQSESKCETILIK